MEKAHLTDSLIGLTQKISHWLIKTMLLGESETEISSGIKSGFGILGFGTSDPTLGLWFSL